MIPSKGTNSVLRKNTPDDQPDMIWAYDQYSLLKQANLE